MNIISETQITYLEVFDTLRKACSEDLGKMVYVNLASSCKILMVTLWGLLSLMIVDFKGNKLATSIQLIGLRSTLRGIEKVAEVAFCVAVVVWTAAGAAGSS